MYLCIWRSVRAYRSLYPELNNVGLKGLKFCFVFIKMSPVWHDAMNRAGHLDKGGPNIQQQSHWVSSGKVFQPNLLPHREFENDTRGTWQPSFSFLEEKKYNSKKSAGIPWLKCQRPCSSWRSVQFGNLCNYQCILISYTLVCPFKSISLEGCNSLELHGVSIILIYKAN